MMQYSGPVPHPSILKGFEEIVPGSAKQILDDAHGQTVHRQTMERNALRWEGCRSTGGLLAGASISVLGLLLAYFAIMAGHDVAGATIATVDWGAIVAVFVTGVRASKGRAEHPAENEQPKKK